MRTEAEVRAREFRLENITHSGVPIGPLGLPVDEGDPRYSAWEERVRGAEAELAALRWVLGEPASLVEEPV